MQTSLVQEIFCLDFTDEAYCRSILVLACRKYYHTVTGKISLTRTLAVVRTSISTMRTGQPRLLIINVR